MVVVVGEGEGEVVADCALAAACYQDGGKLCGGHVVGCSFFSRWKDDMSCDDDKNGEHELGLNGVYIVNTLNFRRDDAPTLALEIKMDI